MIVFVFFFKQKTAYEMRISDWSSDVCSSDLKDREMALGLQQWLKEHGLDLYIDWQDASMPETPDGTTAGRIRTMIRNADVFLFLATSDSLTSRWCPWELGFADGDRKSVV